MKALVTGGAGFIGSHLVEFLESQDWEVRIYDTFSGRNQFDFDVVSRDFISGDVRDSKKLSDAAVGCKVIFHLAGSVGTDYLVNQPTLAVTSNIIGTLNVLETAKASGARVIYLSVLPNWPNSYMITKKAAEAFCSMYHKEFDTQVTVFQAAHIYGPRQCWRPAQKAVPNFISQALLDMPISIYGTGHQLMDLLHVSDACHVLYQAAIEERSVGSMMELGSGSSISVIDLVSWIIEECGSSSNIQFLGKRPGEPLSDESFQPANISLLQGLLGFTPQISFTAGFRSTIEWYREQVVSKGIY